MAKVLGYSLLLVLGMAGSQVLPWVAGAAFGPGGWAANLVTLLTMWALSFIMIHVGFEFDLDKSNLRQYGWDYVVAMTAAAFPWVFVTGYFLLVMLPPGEWQSLPAWKETLLAGRFAAPTSAGVLFAMLAAAGLAATWVYAKARVLAIFDDLDTVLLMVPLKMLMVGLAWQLGAIVLFIVVLLWLAWRYLHAWRLPTSWPWLLGYGFAIAAVSEAVYVGSKSVDPSLPIHIEVLLPAFVLGCMLVRPAGHEHPSPAEERVATLVSALFMVLVGLSMPALFLGDAPAAPPETVTAAQPMPSAGVMALHVIVITILSNLGKMFPAFCYRREAHWRERLALAIGMWPRGEVGAGVLIVSLGYGIGGPVLTVAILSLALNLALTGIFIAMVKRLLAGVTPR